MKHTTEPAPIQNLVLCAPVGVPSQFVTAQREQLARIQCGLFFAARLATVNPELYHSLNTWALELDQILNPSPLSAAEQLADALNGR